MGISGADLRREQTTMLMSLYLHVLDAQSTDPVLADRFAAPILARIDHDEAALRRLRGNQPLIVARAKAVDDLVRDFLFGAPDAVVVHAGCGLDSRVLRVNPGPGVSWFEIDQAPVIALRRRVYRDRDGVTTIAASVTDPQPWSDVPTGRPLLVVAEGLLMYLSPADLRATCALVAGVSAPTTTLVADTVAPWVRRVSGWQPNMRSASTGFASTTDDLDAAMSKHPRFSTRTRTSLVTAAAHATTGSLARFITLIDRLPAGHRAMTLTTRTSTSTTEQALSQVESGRISSHGAASKERRT